ncbi:MOSC domain-containing protein [Brevibacillus borstelensis]|uniref:MOSC domain-containing protein n=2 Tax=Brevibacillus borstelensis TaxID=45462 RepID=UPI002E1BBC1B|nr:MOSC domain-containing protein [Brevibacillus borstelensis]
MKKLEGRAREMQLVSINVGKPQTVMHNGKEVSTAIWKYPVTDRRFLDWEQLDGDGQADRRFHGGKDKALMVYSYDHYSFWEEKLGQELAPGAFGENVTVRGLDESTVSIGDIFQLGEAVVQVSQPRQPCFKLDVRLQRSDMVSLIQQTGYSGFYMRVLETGMIGQDMEFRLLEKSSHNVTVSFINQIKYHKKDNLEAIRRILAVKELADSWRPSLEKRLTT